MTSMKENGRYTLHATESENDVAEDGHSSAEMAAALSRRCVAASQVSRLQLNMYDLLEFIVGVHYAAAKSPADATQLANRCGAVPCVNTRFGSQSISLPFAPAFALKLRNA